MPTYVYIQFYPAQASATAPPPIKIRADRVETLDDGKMVLAIGGERVAEINVAVQAWWKEDEA